MRITTSALAGHEVLQIFAPHTQQAPDPDRRQVLPMNHGPHHRHRNFHPCGHFFQRERFFPQELPP